MKCQDCKTKNIKKAYFCKHCGREFSEKERKNASKKGIIGLIKRIEKWYDLCTLKVITDNIIFKILSIVLLLGVGVYNLYTTGNGLRIEENNKYNIKYNKKENEYYVFMTENNNINENGKLKLDFYIPNNIDNINIKYYSETNEEIYSLEIPKEEEMEFLANTDKNNYYIVSANNKKIKIYIYYKEVGDNIEK